MPRRRARVLTWLTTAGLVSGVLISWPLWRTERGYPRVPIFGTLLGMWSPPAPFDLIWVALFLAVAGWLAVRGPGRAAVAVLIALAAWWCAADQSRLQPWFWQYVWMLAVLGLRAPDDDASARRALGACALIVAGTYFWSGSQKFNGGFVYETFPWLTAPLTGGRPTTGPRLAAVGWLAGPLEACGGLALLFPRSRLVAVAFLAGMHALILVCVGPWGHAWNHVVWPWNVFMVAAMAVLFLGRPDPLPRLLPPARLDWPAARLVLVFWWLLPAASLVGLWDAYLSSALYSGRSLRAGLEVRAGVLDRLPEPSRRVARPLRPGWYRVPIQEWSMAAMRASAYPARRVLTGVGQAAADQADAAGDVTLVIDEHPDWRTGDRARTRIELAPRSDRRGREAMIERSLPTRL